MIRASIIALLILISANILPQDSTYLIFDMPCNDSLPIHFRKSNETIHTSGENLPDTTGLASLNASGSAEFCSKSLKVMIDNIGREKVIIVDLRQESHGFVNGICISWPGTNVGFSEKDSEAEETRRLDSLLKTKNISVSLLNMKDRITETGKIPLVVSSALTEKELAGQLKADYFRIAVTDRRKPQNKDADRFIEFINALGIDMWLHFHCQAGYGRTTTFLAMYDMMKNSKKVTLQDILQRQYLLGGINLSRIDDIPGIDKKDAQELAEFLNDFYNYCRADSDNFATSFSMWLAKKKN